MRVHLIVLFAMSFNFIYGQSSSRPVEFNVDSFITAKRTAPLGKPFPIFNAISEGGKISNELLKNKVVLINFWFEGCLPCMVEMEALNELQQKMKDKKDFLFISFTWDNPEAVERVKKRYGITFGVLSTSEEECRQLHFNNGYPTNIILDRTGTVKFLHSGGSTKKEEAREFIMTTLISQIMGML